MHFTLMLVVIRFEPSFSATGLAVAVGAAVVGLGAAVVGVGLAGAAVVGAGAAVVVVGLAGAGAGVDGAGVGDALEHDNEIASITAKSITTRTCKPSFFI